MTPYYSIGSFLIVTQLLLYTLIILLLPGCNNSTSSRHKEFRQWVEEKDKIRVLSTTAMINDLVKQVGGDEVATLTLIQGELDPHSYQLVKGDDEKLAMADIIFYNGLGLEHGPSIQRYLSNSTKALAIGNRIPASSIIYVGNQKDPHIWMDVSLWAETIPAIAEKLSHEDPDHAALFRENARRLTLAMQHTHQQIKELMHRIPEQDRYLVTSHDAFNYFARAYMAEDSELKGEQWRKRFMAPEGLSPESQLSAADIKLIIDHLKKHHISTLFSESNVSRDSITKILQASKEEGLEIQIACCSLYSDAMGASGSDADSYLKMMDYDAKMITSHLLKTAQTGLK